MLSQSLARYVDLQRSLGFKFRIQHILLRGFAAFAEQHGDRHIKSARVLAWAARAPSPEQRRNRLLTVRRFALAMHAEDGRHEVPAADALGHAVVRRRPPYIYTPGEVAKLIRAAAALMPTDSMRPLTYATLLGLLAATGMRISEALALQLVDVTADGLLIRPGQGTRVRTGDGAAQCGSERDQEQRPLPCSGGLSWRDYVQRIDAFDLGEDVNGLRGMVHRRATRLLECRR